MARFAGTETSARLSAARPAEPAAADFDRALVSGALNRALADPQAVERFFALLFARHPQLRALFPLAMTRTRQAVRDGLAQLFGDLPEAGRAEELLAQVARDHRRLGVRDRHYRPFFEALGASAREALGPAWTAELDAAWLAATDWFVSVLAAAAARDAAERPAWWLGEVVRHDRRSDTVAVLTIRPDAPLRYLPGQHVSVQVPQWPRVWREYSIANAPRESGLVDLHVRAVPGGLVSTFLVRYCGPGDVVVLGPPRGAMTAPLAGGRDLVCVAGGTGLAPVKAITEAVVAAAGTGRRRAITLYLGARDDADLYDMRELETLALGYPPLTLVTVTGQATPGRGADGRASGLIRAVAAHPSFRDTDVYVSGPAGLVSAVIRALAARVPSHRVLHDPLPLLRAASEGA